jgi:hypothetical protein
VTLDVGTVFRWKDFPGPRGGGVKARWFIYLGDSGYFSQVLLAYICTTTTQIQHFQLGGDRSSHDHFIFKKWPSSPFEDDCILDFDEPPHTPRESILEKNPSIEEKGKLDEQALRMIYNRLCRSNAYSKIILRDIHESFNKAGIIGLKRPK